MDETRLSRRALLAAGAGTIGALAGCTAPSSSTLELEESNAGSFDRENRADGSVYTEVYEATLDAVPFIRVFGVEDPMTGEDGRGQGSGFLVDDTHVVTNHHVVAGADEIDLQYPNGTWTSATVAGTDFYSDLAVIEVATSPDVATPLSFADVRPTVGQEVLAIGNPYGLEGSMSRGIVSGVDRSIRPPGREFAFSNVVQTDAAVNPGNSGGPLVDMDGRVVGVINAGWGETIGLAISAALASRVVPALIRDGEYRHSLVGVVTRPVDRRIAAANDLPEPRGVIVTDVIDDGPSDGALRGSDDTVEENGEPLPVGGDVIVGIDGEPIHDQHTFSTYIALETSPGDTIAFEVVRDGDRETVEVTLDARPRRS